MVPDRLPEGLRELITRFPSRSLQFEVGIQTFNEEVAARISRRQNYAALEDNFRFLREQTGVHLHADLIIGLPGESVASFAVGFDRLVRMGPQEIQVGILKRLRGTPIGRHDAEWGMCYNPLPPYDILRSRMIDFPTMQRLRRFAKYWDLVANSGNFLETTPLLWCGPEASPFHSFLAFSDGLYAQERRTDSLSLLTLVERLFAHLTGSGLDAQQVAASLAADYTRPGRHDLPAFLKEHLPEAQLPKMSRSGSGGLPKRQARHTPGK
jgi:hypothetical protein